MDMLAEIATKLGCKFSVRLVSDGKYGRYDSSTGSWTGMVGEVVSGSVEMAVADLTTTASRERAVDFTVPFLHVGITILYKKPSWARRMTASVNSVDDLARQTKIKFGTVKGGSTSQFFKVSWKFRFYFPIFTFRPLKWPRTRRFGKQWKLMKMFLLLTILMVFRKCLMVMVSTPSS